MSDAHVTRQTGESLWVERIFSWVYNNDLEAELLATDCQDIDDEDIINEQYKKQRRFL